VSVSSPQLSFNHNHPSKTPDAEELARDLFERARPNDSFDDLKRRAAFNRQEAGRLRHWIRAAQAIAAERDLRQP
jgi:hypothetical protein